MTDPIDPSSSFEDAMERLETIVHQMEAGELPLEEMLQRYEEGTRLVKLCTSRLSAAEQRIEVIARNAAGEPETIPLDSNPHESAAGSKEPKDPKGPTESKEPKPSKPAPRASARKTPSPEEEDVSLF